MALPQGGSRRALRLVPDTGAEALVLFERRGDNAKFVSAAGVRLTSVTGSRAAHEIVVSRLVVGASTLRDRRAVVVQRDDTDADGLLPLHDFSSVSFAARGACALVRK
jgi:aspartyl protease